MFSILCFLEILMLYKNFDPRAYLLCCRVFLFVCMCVCICMYMHVYLCKALRANPRLGAISSLRYYYYYYLLCIQGHVIFPGQETPKGTSPMENEHLPQSHLICLRCCEIFLLLKPRLWPLRDFNQTCWS